MKRLFLISIFFAAASVVVAGSLYVDDDAVCDPGPGNPLVSDPAEDGSQAHPFDAIQQAIDAAVNDDEVIILPGTYRGDGNRDIDYGGKAITVRSTDPANLDVVERTVIDCQGNESDPHRGFCFQSGEDPNSILDGITITNGYGKDYSELVQSIGGGICCLQSNPLIRNCIIRGNSALKGGGFYGGGGHSSDDGGIMNCIIADNFAGHIGGGVYSYPGRIVGCTITANTARVWGGGLYNCKGAITNCTVTNNIAEYGGGGGLYGCHGVIDNCLIAGNIAGIGGGGLYCCEGFIVDCTVTGNEAGTIGGGLSNCRGRVQDSLISGNRTGGNGGGIGGKVDYLSLDVVNCVISGNFAAGYGGGVHVTPLLNYRADQYLNCTIADNRALLKGGGVSSASAFIELENCILYGNHAPSGTQIAVHRFVYPHAARGPLTITHSNVEGGVTQIHLDEETESYLVWGGGNTDIDPRFADPGHWDPNGTPDDLSDDFWIDGDYHLRSQAGRWEKQLKDWVTDEVTSPCIDAGNVDSAIGYEPFPNGGVVNMGAYGGTTEASKSYFGTVPCETILAGDINGDCIVNLADLAILSRHWLKDAR